MKTRRIIALLLALAMICGVFAACGKKEEEPAPAPSTSTEEKQETKKDYKDYTLEDWIAEGEALKSAGKAKYKILYMPSWAASEYFVNSNDIWKKEFEEIGWELDFIGPKEYTADSQLSVLESALTSGEYDGIILYPIDPNTFAAVKDDYWETYHIPLFAWGFAEATGCAQYYAQPGENHAINGERIAKAIIKYVEDNKDYFGPKYLDAGKKVPYYVCGSAANPNQNVRILKAIEILEADGRFECIFHDEQVSESKDTDFAESFIMNYGKDTEIMLMYNDVHAINYINAMESSSVKFSDYIALFGFDGIKAGAKLMQEKGKDSLLKGTSLSAHAKVGQIIIDCFSVAVPAAQQKIIVDGLSDKLLKDLLDESYYGPDRVIMTPDNVWDWYPDKL